MLRQEQKQPDTLNDALVIKKSNKNNQILWESNFIFIILGVCKCLFMCECICLCMCVCACKESALQTFFCYGLIETIMEIDNYDDTITITIDFR